MIQKKEPCIIWWRIRALGFHQEQMETTEDSTEILGLVLYQTLYYLLSVFH